MNKFLLSALFFLGVFSINAQLKNFTISPVKTPETPIVQANSQFSDNALIIVFSDLEDLNFRSSIGGINRQRYNSQAGRYEILISPQRQIIFVQKSGFRETRVGIINPQAKEVFYFEVQSEQNRFSNVELTANQQRILELEKNIKTAAEKQEFALAAEYQKELKLREELEEAINSGNLEGVVRAKKALINDGNEMVPPMVKHEPSIITVPRARKSPISEEQQALIDHIDKTILYGNKQLAYGIFFSALTITTGLLATALWQEYYYYSGFDEDLISSMVMAGGMVGFSIPAYKKLKKYHGAKKEVKADLDKLEKKYATELIISSGSLRVGDRQAFGLGLTLRF
ncbi:MAG: hypothetical protein JJU02_12940 [Cryomorphaceae bacterium]|nr:hypothetical protein [Cryomorphaceae bacterium]